MAAGKKPGKEQAPARRRGRFRGFAKASVQRVSYGRAARRRIPYLGPVHIGTQSQEAARHCRACRGNLAPLGTVVAVDVDEIPATSEGLRVNRLVRYWSGCRGDPCGRPLCRSYLVSNEIANAGDHKGRPYRSSEGLGTRLCKGLRQARV